MRTRNRPLLALMVLLVLSACSSSSEPAARAAATSFQQAVGRHDGSSACGLLSTEARARLETASGRPCAAALEALALPAGDVSSEEVWGGQAQVRLTSQVLFLAEFRDGWRVTGAGCTPRPDQPYDCLVRA
jgi:hypothetical protein